MTIFRHVVHGSDDSGATWSTSMHSSSVQSLTAAATAWAVSVQLMGQNGGIAERWPLSTKIEGYNTYELNASGFAVGQTVQTMQFAGLDTGQQLPQRLAFVLGHLTNVPGARGRGRMYWPIFSSTFMDEDGQIDDVAREAIVNFWTVRLRVMAASGVVPVIWGGPASAGPIPITSVRASQVPGSQRRRTNKVPAGYVGANL